MKPKKHISWLLALAAAFCVTSCSAAETSPGSASGAESVQQTASLADRPEGAESFAQAHDAFQTTLIRQDRDDDPIPEPPEGVFDLIRYPSKVGDLAAYISSDPGDGERHPLIIWVVGGWGNGISDFPWTYPDWENDQTASAFWRSGILTMYPSFRGGNGNPGYYEALFGEVDDLVAACDYAASLPYVDPDRIYLGGHSTGGTRALLAAEYTDRFRAVFCFGPVDLVKYHNNDQFTFDTSADEEFVMRSPVYWLDDVRTPTFLIEGSLGNASRLKKILEATDNPNINGYVVMGADHFSVLGPVTPLVAEKILADTGSEPNIMFSQSELTSAMIQKPSIPLPVMTTYESAELGLTFSYPFLWEVTDLSEDGERNLLFSSPYEEDNIWDMALFELTSYETDEKDYLQSMAQYLEDNGYKTSAATVDGLPALEALGTYESSDGNLFSNRYLMVQKGETFIGFDFFIHESFGSDADPLFQSMIDSISFAP